MPFHISSCRSLDYMPREDIVLWNYGRGLICIACNFFPTPLPKRKEGVMYHHVVCVPTPLPFQLLNGTDFHETWYERCIYFSREYLPNVMRYTLQIGSVPRVLRRVWRTDMWDGESCSFAVNVRAPGKLYQLTLLIYIGLILCIPCIILLYLPTNTMRICWWQKVI